MGTPALCALWHYQQTATEGLFISQLQSEILFALIQKRLRVLSEELAVTQSVLRHLIT